MRSQILVALGLLAMPCAAQMRVGMHPNAEWISVSPRGRWLYSGFSWDALASSEKATPTRRYDLRTGHWHTANVDYPSWVSNGQIAETVGTEAETLQSSSSMEGDQAPVVGLLWPTGTHPTVVLRDKMFAGDPYRYHGTALSADGRTATVLSMKFVRRFDARTGHLKARLKNPISEDERGFGALSSDGRFLLSSQKVRLYEARTGKLRRVFFNREPAYDLDWITPTIFVLTRRKGERTYTEFWDAVTLKRLWVLADTLKRDLDGSTAWRSYPLIPQPNAVIACGHNIWTWRDARSGRVLREAIAPKVTYRIEVSGNNYFYLDKNGVIWRGNFRFISRRK